MRSEHLTNEELQLFVDGTLPASEMSSTRLHIQTCARCRIAHESLLRLDASLRSLRVEQLGADFTRSVLANLNIIPQSSFLFSVVENLGYVFGLMIVLGIMLTAFILTGVIDQQQVSQTQSIVGSASSAIGGKMNSMIDALTIGLQSYLPFVFGGGSLKIAVMGTLVIGMLAVVDKIVRRRIM